jgi:hypothetical protein
MTNSAAQQREHEYVNTTTRWDNCRPLQVIDQSIVRSVLCAARGSGPRPRNLFIVHAFDGGVTTQAEVTLGCRFWVYVAHELRTIDIIPIEGNRDEIGARVQRNARISDSRSPKMPETLYILYGQTELTVVHSFDSIPFEFSTELSIFPYIL